MIPSLVYRLSQFVDAAWPIVAAIGIGAIVVSLLEGNRKDAEAGRRFWRITAVIWILAFFLLWLKHRQIL